MNNRLKTNLYDKNVSIEVVGEFLLACAAIGEDKVIHALRNAQQMSATNLKKYIIDVTCREFKLDPSFIRKVKLGQMSDEQQMCFAVVIFLIKKHMRITYAEIRKLLWLNKIPYWQNLCKYSSLIPQLDKKEPVHQKYIRLIDSADNQIKQYILTSYSIYNVEENPTQRNGSK